MDNREHRFDCQEEPGGTWAVWDRVADQLASLGGVELKGCAQQRATAAEAVLSRIYGCGLDAWTVRRGGRSAAQ
jgi:hypothetical protein